MLRILAAAATVAAAIGLSATANAATVIEFTDEQIGDGGLAFYGDFPAPEGNSLVEITLRYTGLNLLPDTSFSAEYRGLYYYWENDLNEVRFNDIYSSVTCSLSNGCISITGPGEARATFRAPPDLGSLEDCVSGSEWPCHTHYSHAYLQFFTGFANRTGGPAWVQITVGDVMSAVPEPKAWIVMIVGFAGAGIGLRANRRRPVRGIC